MATGYHLNVNPVSRGKGQSVIAKAAYNSREKLREERTGEVKDYTQKNDRPLWSGIFADSAAPAWAQDRAQLWNRADCRDKRKDAQIAYNIIAALPHQLTQQQREYIVKDFIREQFLRRGVAADGHMHGPDPKGDDRNYHVHILVSMRELTPDGFGERVLTWDDRHENLARWRDKWAERCAKELRKAGQTLEADRWREGHRTLEQQRRAALERGDAAFVETLKHREATKHRGPAVDAMERKGRTTERGNIHRDVVAANTSRAINAALKSELAEVQKAIAQEERAWADRLHQAAIDKEKIERRFVEPKPAHTEPQRGTLAAAGAQERERRPVVPAAPPATPAQWSGLRSNPAATNQHAAELSLSRAAREVTQPEGPPTKPDQLRGPAAEIWTAYSDARRRRDPFAFSDAVDKQGSVLARVTKEEADHSREFAPYWKAWGESAPVYRQGEFVVIDRRGEVWKLNHRTTGDDPARIQAFLDKADWKGALPGIDRAREIVKHREAQRQVERQTIRAEIDAGRLKRATKPAGPDRKGRDTAPTTPNLAKAAKRTIGGAIGALGKLADGFSLDALTPGEKHEAAKLRHANEREAEEGFDFLNFVADKEKAKREQQQREAEAQQQRDRDRDRR